MSQNSRDLSISVPASIQDVPPTPRLAVIKLWVVFVLTLLLAGVLIASSHVTHSITLRVEAYHCLYNLGALVGSLLSIKLCRQPQSLRQTFGWARIDVVSYLISLIFLSSLCFSAVIEAVQTACHVEHQDPMHYPVPTMMICLAGVAVNVAVFVLIGGYSQHQGSYLLLKKSGEVIARDRVGQDSLQKGLQTMSGRKRSVTKGKGPRTFKEGALGICRDISGLVITLVCACIVHTSEGGLVGYYIDPALAVLSVSVLCWLSIPFGLECGHILLQTIPGHVDVASLPQRLRRSFPGVEDLHHLHVWSLRPGKVVATVHLVFSSEEVYKRSQAALQIFFKNEGISLVTLQPEFSEDICTKNSKCRCVDHSIDGKAEACDDAVEQKHSRFSRCSSTEHLNAS